MIKQHLKLVHVDAFSRSAFRGAQVAVCVLPTALRPEQMLTAAQELCVPDCVFVMPAGDGRFILRAFTPWGESDSVGTPALAAAHVLFTEGFAGRTDGATLVASDESFAVERRAEHTSLIVTPRKTEGARALAPALTARATGGDPRFNGRDYILPLATEADVRAFALPLADDWNQLGSATRIAVTAVSGSGLCDYVARVFAPPPAQGVGTRELQACGANARALGPYWMERLGLEIVRGEQLHGRGGVVHTELAAAPGHIAVSGQSITTIKSLFTHIP